MTSRRPLKGLLVGAAAAAVVMSFSACSSSNEGDGSASSSTGSSDCSAYTQYGDLNGKTVTIYTSIASDTEAQPHIDSFDMFEQCTGVTIKYEGDREFESQMPIRVEAGNAPDLAYFPQPGLLNTIVTNYPDAVVKANDLSNSNIKKYYATSIAEYGQVDGVQYGVPVGINVKSFVWYSPSMFKEKGYTEPKTLDELMTLTQKIAAESDGLTKPWCAGFESGNATGWPGTDWVEDMMLRTGTPEQYDQWVSHDIKFNDPVVVEAMDKAGAILKNADYVNGGLGGVETIATTPFTDGGYPIQEGTCWMHRQASFYQANWPDGTTVAEDGDVWAFYLPGETAEDHPVLGGGEYAMAFRDAPEVAAVQAYLTSPEWSNIKAQKTPNGGWLSANKSLDPANLVKPVDKLSYEIISDENTVFKFDASDLMPSAVGAGTFWTGMVNWISQGESSQEVADSIEASWPKK